MRRYRKHRQAFTVVELTLALALAAMLMVGVMGVLASIRPPAVDPNAPGDRDVAPVVELIAADLQHARVYRNAPGRITLAGFIATTPGGRPSHRPARVVYRTQELGDRTWLVRRETALDVPSNQNTRTQLVAPGIAGIGLGELARGGDMPSDRRNDPFAALIQKERFVPVASKLQLTLGFSDPKRAPIQRTLLAR